MGAFSIAWKLGNEPGVTGMNSGRDGDTMTIQPADHEWNALERTEMGIAVVTDVPDEIISKIHARCDVGVRRVKIVKALGDDYYLIESSNMPEFWWLRRYSVSKAQCLVEWPGLAAKIEKLFDPTFTVPADQVPSLPWAKFAKVFYDRVKEEFVADLGA